MAAIGDLEFEITSNHDAGIALLLVKPPEEEISTPYGECHITASPNDPYVVLRFRSEGTFDDSCTKGAELIQEALDILSMTGRGDLVTRNADSERVVWGPQNGRRTFRLMSTATSSFKAGPLEISVKDANGSVIPPTRTTPQHHLGFRFYRHSQVSDDLYDGYRNMYLAFECLLSSRYHKERREQEIQWLRRALSAASGDLDLPNLAPSSASAPVDHILKVIYNRSRLPLFHAKVGREYFAPIDETSERNAVLDALSTLTQLVIRMADVWYSVRRISSCINLEIFEKQNSILFDDARFVYSDDAGVSLSDVLNSKSIPSGLSSPARFFDSFESQPRQHLFGEFHKDDFSKQGRFHAAYVVNDSTPLIGYTPDTSIDLSGFDTFQLMLFFRGHNAGLPKHLFQR